MKWKVSLVVCLLFSTSYLFSQGDASRTEANIDLVQQQYGLTGNGVLTIMMDRGIDYRHPDFLHPDGTTRIAYIYDLYDDTGANDSDNPYGKGTVYTSDEINAALQAGGTPIVNDVFGHGTATTGIMSGNGTAVNSDEFKGVATEATIISIIVSKDFVPPFDGNPGQQGQFNPLLLPKAFEFAEDKIAELNMPSVTLLNIGSIQDPTDGTVGVCLLFDQYAQNGNAFVCGVGDDGGKDNHMILGLTQNQTSEIQIEKGEAGNLRFVGWYDDNDNIEFTIQRPNGQIEGPFTPPTSSIDAQDVFLENMNIYHRGADVEFSSSSSNRRQLLIDMFGENGTYTISITPTEVNSDGTFNGLLNPAYFYNNNSFLNNTNPGGNIHSYSSCLTTISPGDYVATTMWTDINGIDRVKNGEGEVGELWLGSSIGPTMDGRLGVDFVAPGEIASAAYGEDSYYSFFEGNTLENSNGFYGIQTAVSAAAPITAGVIALMLEVNPSLTPDEILMLLQQSARTDNFTGDTPNVEWGHGKLDALAAIELAYMTVGIENNENSIIDFKIAPNPTSDFAYVQIANVENLSDNSVLSLFTLKGEKIKEINIESSIKIDMQDIPRGLYVLKLEDQNQQMTKLISKL